MKQNYKQDEWASFSAKTCPKFSPRKISIVIFECSATLQEVISKYAISRKVYVYDVSKISKQCILS